MYKIIVFMICLMFQTRNESIASAGIDKFSRRRIHSTPSQDTESVIKYENLTLAVKDIALGLPVTHLTLVYDEDVAIQFIESMIRKLHSSNIMTRSYCVPQNPFRKKEYWRFAEEVMAKHEGSNNIIFASPDVAERILKMVKERNLIQRNVLYIFYWKDWPLSKRFVNNIQEAMRVAIITNPRNGTYRVYYNQASSKGNNEFKLVNWWSTNVMKLFRLPVLPLASKVYHNFHRRLFLVPVLHKPPWNFVEYSNGSMSKVDGGRDDKLLALVASKLNFKYEYFDPPDRSQGSAITKNGTFPGVIGLIWRREVDFFLGDVTVTYERSRVVEFSFMTLADSGAFVTRAPGHLNEALALVRPFQWQVWPPVLVTVMLYGPILFFVIEAPSLWRSRRRENISRKKLLGDCIWFSTSIFLRQTVKEVSHTHKSRLLTILLSFAATYVIGDMYSAYLTSLLARPAREPPISSILQLEIAMRTRGYQLLVESHSSSYGILQNGTGIYRRLWDLMTQQRRALIESVESGMKLVRDHKTYVLLGGRETLYFDTRRFGAHNFHLSEKLYTRYAAIAMQIGCPFVENFNHILMKLFEAGILSKITEEEYKKLGEKLRADKANGESDNNPDIDEDDKNIVDNQGRPGEDRVEEGSGTISSKEASRSSEEQKLRPISMTMLQGAFYVLVLGYLLSGTSLAIEFFVTWFSSRYPNFRIPRPKLDLRPCYRLWHRTIGHCSDVVTTHSPEDSYATFEYID